MQGSRGTRVLASWSFKKNLLVKLTLTTLFIIPAFTAQINSARHLSNLNISVFVLGYHIDIIDLTSLVVQVEVLNIDTCSVEKVAVDFFFTNNKSLNFLSNARDDYVFLVKAETTLGDLNF